MSLRIKAVQVAQVKGRPLFFDANVLLYLFGAVATPKNQWLVEAYTKVFSDCLKMQSVLCVDIFVLSEFINRSLRLDYENYLKMNGLDKSQLDFKTFRATPDGEQLSKGIETVVKGRILKQFKLVGKLFNPADITAISLVNHDFNDALIIQTCQAHHCVLVTNDADFSGADLDILTANNKLV